MKFIYLTAKHFPGTTADHRYIENLAGAFAGELGSDFSFVKNVQVPSFLKRTVYFFFWIPLFWIRNRADKTIFFGNDQNLLAILVFWKKFLGFSYKIAADWHMMSETWRDSYIARNADYSFTTSKKLEKAVRKIFPGALVSTVYGGVDLSPFEIAAQKEQLRSELNLPQDKFLFGYVGLFKTLGLEKGILTMISSLASLPEDFVAVFVGRKENEIDFYKKFAEEKNVVSRCIFAPLQNFQNVVKYEKAMDALVIPYPDAPHFRKYGFPMKIYEYMASGTPTVYTKLELLEEVVSNCAFGIAPDSPAAIADALKDMKNNPEKAQELARNALDEVKKYTWKERARNILLCVTM